MKKMMALAGCGSGSTQSGTTAAPASSGEDKGTETAGKEDGDSAGKDGLYFAVSLGWMENASGQRQKFAFEQAFAQNNITNFGLVDANYDAKKQSEQIEAFIAKKPDALFVTPSDPIGIAEAVSKAANSGIKVFCSDGYVPGAEVASSVMFDNYAGGKCTMQYLADRLIAQYPEGDIIIGMITLPSNEGWDAREHGAKEIKAIWCAWDGAAFEGLAVTASTRPEIVYTGSDGGEECYKKMQQYPDQFVMTLAESVYEMPTTFVGYAMTSMNGGRIPRIVMSQGYAITSDMIMDVYEIKDKTGTVDGQELTAWQLALDYDLPGYTDALNAVLEENGKEAALMNSHKESDVWKMPVWK